MRLICCLCLAASIASTRPRYGGTLLLETSGAPSAVDAAQFESAQLRRLVPLWACGLVRLDARARPTPGLAVSWSHDASMRRWQFTLRPNVRTHDGAVLAPAAVEGVLRAALRGRTVTVNGDTVSIQSSQPIPVVLMELAGVAAAIPGTGPFRVAEFIPNRGLLLTAHDLHWDGRPYLDQVSIRFGRSGRDQLGALDAGQADVIELPLAGFRGQPHRRHRLWPAAALDLVALSFSRSSPAVQPESVRRGIALTVDRLPMVSVLLQKQGESTASLVPQLLSGFAFLFPSGRDLSRARSLLTPPPPPLTLAVEGADPVLRSIADRIALNAREAGVLIRPGAAAAPDLTLLRLSAPAPSAPFALEAFARALRLPFTQPAQGLEELYQAESKALEGDWAIPLFHVPELYGLSRRVRDFVPSLSFGWRIEDVWLEVSP